MKKQSMILTFSNVLLLAFIFCGLNAKAQFFVTPSKQGSVTETPGFYYALPRNVLKVDVVIEKTEKFKGPYSDFSEKVLGVSDFIKLDETHYAIKDMILEVETEADPQTWFFVEFDERGSKDARSLVFDLHSNGVILAADEAAQPRVQRGGNITEKTIINGPDEQRFQYFAERNLYQRIDTIVRKITIDTTVIRRNILQTAWVDRNPEQKARSAADMIHKIRESRFNLISGFQEIDYGQSIVYMDQQLQSLEEEYLSLFLGKEVKQLYVKTLYYIPDPANPERVTIAGFSETIGLTDATSKATAIELEFTTSDIGKNTEKPNSRLNNSLYYRLPASTGVKLIYAGKTFVNERVNISQFGSVGVAPVNKTRLQFDAESGMITTIKRE